MPLVRIINNTVIKGLGHVGVGTTHEVDVKTATALFIAGKAVPAKDEPAKPFTRKKRAVKRMAKK